MLDQFESPVKPKIDMQMKLTPEEKLHFALAQEMDPIYSDANRKLEETLLKCNGSKFRLKIPSNRNGSAVDSRAMDDSIAQKKVTSDIDTTVVNLNTSNDIFDQMVAAKFADRSNVGGANDVSKSNSFIDASNHSFDERIEEKSSQQSENESMANDQTPTPKPLGKGNKFVFRTATASKPSDKKNNETKSNPIDNIERKKTNSTAVSESKINDSDKYDVDTVLRELSFENQLPIGANRARPVSPPRNTLPSAKKPLKTSNSQRKEVDKSKVKPRSSSTKSRSNISSSSHIDSALSTSTDQFNTSAGMITKDPQSKTGFENLQNVLDLIANSSAVKTTSNVSSLRFLFLKFLFRSEFPHSSQVVPHWKSYKHLTSN